MDVQEEPLFTIVSIFQGIVTYSIAVIDTGIEGVPFYLILIACGYLRTLRVRLLSLTDIQDRINENNKGCTDNASELFYNDVRDCARFHQQIMA